MAHPLDGAIQRIHRADRYIKEVEDLIKEFGSECEDRIIASWDPKLSQFKVDFPDPHPNLPLAVSDAVHNLRAALDYLVYELALKDSGSEKHGTQFPIEEFKLSVAPNGNKIGFDVVAPRYLKGLNAEHIAVIESMQPYRGAEWARDLKDISNRDKHRKLIHVEKGDKLSVWVSRPNSELKSKRLINGSPIQVDGHQTVKIALPNRNAFICTTLYSIQAAASDAINLLYRDF